MQKSNPIEKAQQNASRLLGEMKAEFPLPKRLDPQTGDFTRSDLVEYIVARFMDICATSQSNQHTQGEFDAALRVLRKVIHESATGDLVYRALKKILESALSKEQPTRVIIYWLQLFAARSQGYYKQVRLGRLGLTIFFANTFTNKYPNTTGYFKIVEEEGITRCVTIFEDPHQKWSDLMVEYDRGCHFDMEQWELAKKQCINEEPAPDQIFDYSKVLSCLDNHSFSSLLVSAKIGRIISPALQKPEQPKPLSLSERIEAVMTNLPELRESPQTNPPYSQLSDVVSKLVADLLLLRFQHKQCAKMRELLQRLVPDDTKNILAGLVRRYIDGEEMGPNKLFSALKAFSAGVGKKVMPHPLLNRSHLNILLLGYLTGDAPTTELAEVNYITIGSVPLLMLKEKSTGNLIFIEVSSRRIFTKREKLVTHIATLSHIVTNWEILNKKLSQEQQLTPELVLKIANSPIISRQHRLFCDDLMIMVASKNPNGTINLGGTFTALEHILPTTDLFSENKLCGTVPQALLEYGHLPTLRT